MHIMLGFLLLCACIVAACFVWRVLLALAAIVAVAVLVIVVISHNPSPTQVARFPAFTVTPWPEPDRATQEMPAPRTSPAPAPQPDKFVVELQTHLNQQQAELMAQEQRDIFALYEKMKAERVGSDVACSGVSNSSILDLVSEHGTCWYIK